MREDLCICGRWAKPDVLSLDCGDCEHQHTYVETRVFEWNNAPTSYLVRVEVDGETAFYTPDEARQLAALLTKKADEVEAEKKEDGGDLESRK